MKGNPSRSKGPLLPVENVSHDDVMAFLNRLEGQRWRLPTEAEWEYACRAGPTGPFSFGNQINTNQVNYNGDKPYVYGQKGTDREKTIPVGSLPPND